MWFDSVLIAVLLVCCYTDLKSRKIYNKLIFPALLVAVISHLILQGFSGLLHSLLGLVVGFGLLLIPYLLGGMGAGDVKLLALVGALKGTVFVLQTSIYMALIGAVIALCILIFKKGILRSIIQFLFSRAVGVKTPLLLDQTKKWFPYGVAIAGGAVSGLLLNGTFFTW